MPCARARSGCSPGRGGRYRRRFVADRQRGRRPRARRCPRRADRHLARPVGDRIVRPGRELVLAAVQRPGIAAALGRHLEAEDGLATTLIQGAGVDWPGPSTVTYSRPSRQKPPRPLKNSSAPSAATGGGGSGDRHRRPAGAAAAAARRAASAVRSSWSARLPRRPSSTTRATASSRARVSAEIRSARSTKTPPAPLSAPRCVPRLAGAHQGLERDLQILDVGGAALVQDDEIDRQPLHAPIFVGAQHCAHDPDILDLVDAHQHDRQVAGDALRPQRRLAAPAPRRIVSDDERSAGSA